MAPTRLRCSNLDRLDSCCPSILAKGPTVIRVAVDNEAAALGKAVHEMAARYVEKGSYNAAEACQHHGVPHHRENEAHMLMAYACRTYDRELERFFPQPQIEASVEGPVLKVTGKEYQISGTIDLCSPTSAERAMFLDWKSGYIDDSYQHQMRGYAYLLWHFMGRPAGVTITGVVVFLRHRYFRVLKYTSKILADWERNLTRNVLGTPDKYAPGKHCVYCDLFASCAARRVVVVGAIDDIMGLSAGKDKTSKWLSRGREILGQLTKENKAEPIVGEVLDDMVFRIRICQQAVDNAKQTIREAIERVGPIPTGPGHALALQPVEIPQLDPTKSMNVLRNHLSDSQICQAMKLSLPKVLTQYLAGQQRGKGREAREKLIKRLEDVGAISIRTQHRLQEVETESSKDEGEANGHVNTESPGPHKSAP